MAVAMSGGKDSLVLAKLLQELKRHGKWDLDLEFICMDPGYLPEVRAQVQANADLLGIPLQIFDYPAFRVADKMAKAQDKPCFICARVRRGALYNQAQALGCNKLALGHHYDDVIETVLMNVLFSAHFKTMMPKIHSQNFEGLELIRPLVYVREESIISWRNYHDLAPIDCACQVSASRDQSSMRQVVKGLIRDLEEAHPGVVHSIYRSAENVELGALLGWKDLEGTRQDFMDHYQDRAGGKK